jgi:hypothetical protein
MCLIHPLVDNGVIGSHDIPQHLLCELLYPMELSVCGEPLPKLGHISTVQLKRHQLGGLADIAIQCEFDHGEFLRPVLLVVVYYGV